MKVNTGVIPPNGWHFPVTAQNILRADSLELLVDQVFTYRLRNGIKPGNVRADIDRYYCARWPSFCVREPIDYGIPNAPGSSEKLDKRVAQGAAILMHAMPQGGYKLVNSDEAERRASICAQCPRNKNWKVSCSSCNSSLVQVLQQIKSLRATKLDVRLFACEVTGRDNGVEVHLPNDIVAATQEEIPLLPPGCWKSTA